jgi:hypothetical protein
MWLRWLLFLPAAVIAMSMMHFILTLDWLDPDRFIKWPWLETMQREAFMRFLEPWAFVAAGGIVAPVRKVSSLGLAGLLAIELIGVLALQVAHGVAGPVVFISALVGVAGAAAGAVTAIRQRMT